MTIGDCKVCHQTSKGGGLNRILQGHGGNQVTACNVCHTGPITTTNPIGFPHQFQQRAR